MMTIKDFLDTLPDKGEPPLVRRDQTAEDVVRVVSGPGRNRVAFVVDGSGVIQGLVTVNHLKDAVLQCYLDAENSGESATCENPSKLFAINTVEDMMDEDVRVCGLDEDLGQVVTRMVRYNRTDLPVLDEGGKVIGILSVMDLFQDWLEGGELPAAAG